MNAFYPHLCSTSAHHTDSHAHTLHAGFLFGNPGVYSRNECKKKGQRSLKGKFALAVAGTFHHGPEPPEQCPCRWLLVCSPRVSSASAALAAALPAALPTAPRSGAGSEHSPGCQECSSSSPTPSLLLTHHTSTFQETSGVKSQINLVFSALLQTICAVLQNFGVPGSCKMQRKKQHSKNPWQPNAPYCLFPVTFPCV